MVEIQGLDELYKSLAGLKIGAAKNAIRFASRKAGKIVQDAAEQRAPIGKDMHQTYLGRKVAPGFIRRNINVRVKTLGRKGAVRVDIGPSKEAFYGTQFVEIGIPSRGIPPRPWLVPSLVENQAEIVRVFKAELSTAITRAIRRGAVK